MVKEATSPLNKIAKGVGIVLVGAILERLLRYIYNMIVARIGATEYGLFTLGISVFGIATTLSLLGLNGGVVRYVSFYKGKGDKERIKGVLISSLIISFCLSLLFGFILFFFSRQISVSIFHNSDLTPILRLFSIIIPFSVLGTIFLKAAVAFQKLNYLIFTKKISENLVKVLFTLIFIFLGYELFGAVAAYMLAIISTFIISFLLLEFKVFPIIRTKIKSIFITKELVYYSWPLLFIGVFHMVVNWTDTIMLGHLKSASEVGIYATANLTTSLIFVSTALFLPIFMPIITELYGMGKLQEVRKVYKVTTKWIFFMIFPLFLLMVFFSKQILSILFGKVYELGFICLNILLVGKLVQALGFTSSSVLGMIKKTKLMFVIGLGVSFLNIGLNYYLIPKYGITGAAIATSISLFIQGLLYMFFVYAFIKIRPITRSYVKILFAGIISLLISSVLYRTIALRPIPLLILAFIIFSLAYVALLVAFKTFEKEDKYIIKAAGRKLNIDLEFIDRLF